MTEILDTIISISPLLYINCGVISFVLYISLHLIQYFYKKYVRNTSKYILLVLKIAIKITKWFFLLNLFLLVMGIVYFFYLFGMQGFEEVNNAL